MVISVKQDSYAHSGLEVYLTKEPEVEVKKIGESGDSEENKENTSTDDSNSELNSDEKFKLLNGETVQIDYYDEMFDNSYEYDYEDISCNASVSMPRVDKNFYKGKKLALLKKWQAPEQKLKWNDLEKVIIGFITEQSYTKNGVNLKIAGITKLLDQEKQFTFTQQKISEILKEMIESAGLKADINVEGLDDKVIDYTNISSSGGSGDAPGIGNAEIDDLVKKWCSGKTSDLEKAEAIHAGLRDEVGIIYQHYYNSKYHTPESCLKHAHSPGLNCGDTAILTTACMKSGGLNAYIVLRCDSAHYFTVIEIGGTKYYSDLTWSEGARSQRAFNDTWENNKCGNKYNLS